MLRITSVLVALGALAFWQYDGSPQGPFRTGLVGNNASAPADVIIIGGGHTGLSAAMTLYRHQHSMLIFDHLKPRNSWHTQTRATSGWNGEAAEKYRQKARREVAQTGFARTLMKEVVNVERKNDTTFQVTDADGDQWFGRKLLLSMGADFVFPDIQGYKENFPERIFHCMFTFGYERRGSEHAGLLAKGSLASVKHALMVAQDTLKFANKVSIYTDANPKLAEEMRPVFDALGESVRIDDRAIARLEQGTGHDIVIVLEDGTSDSRDFLVHQPLARPVPWIVQQLGLELDIMGNVKTNGFFYATNVPGVFAAGDIASPFKIIPNALLMGANAAAGIARELPRHITGNSINA